MKNNNKLAIIAGKGELPRQLISACNDSGREVFIVALEGITDDKTLHNIHSQIFHIGKVGQIIRTLKRLDIKEVVMAGSVSRPDRSNIKPDFMGLILLYKFARLKNKGDDAILRTVGKMLESKGFKMVGADDILSNLITGESGVLGDISPTKNQLNDIYMAVKAARAIGEFDIGQSVIVQNGRIIGVEAAEGTDNLMARCTDLYEEGKSGILVKIKKPNQDERVDLPTIGVQTIENAYNNNIKGLAVDAQSALIIDREKVITRANDLGIFIIAV